MRRSVGRPDAPAIRARERVRRVDQPAAHGSRVPDDADAGNEDVEAGVADRDHPQPLVWGDRRPAAGKGCAAGCPKTPRGPAGRRNPS